VETRDRRAAMRMLAIANELDGYDRDEAARLAGMSDQALRDTIKRVNSEGIDGFYDRPRAGRPRRLTTKQEQEIKSAVLDGPDIEKDGLSAFTLEAGSVKRDASATSGGEEVSGRRVSPTTASHSPTFSPPPRSARIRRSH
jgi:transposase